MEKKTLENHYDSYRETSYNGTCYRDFPVDIHSHVIPGVDDGAQSLEEAVELLRLDREEGIRMVFATPHYEYANDIVRRNAEKYLNVEKMRVA